MRIIIGAALAVVAGACVAGCETGPPMTPAQCQVADWRQVGYQDGAAGRAPERFVALQQACAAAGLPADQGGYMEGRREGLYTYCQPANGFRVGLSGGYYNGVCPPEIDSVFRAALADGTRANSVRAALSSAEGRVSSLRSERDDIEHKIDANELGLIQSQTDAERDRHRNELIRLRGERDRIDRDLRDAERGRRDSARDLDDTRRDLGFRYGDW